jgi:putative phosphoribosyl transferase
VNSRSTTDALFPLQELSININIPSANLEGDLVVPEQAHSLVLFAHGSGSSRRSPRNRQVAEIIQSFGIGTLLFDLLTPQEDTEDILRPRLRFDISLLSERLIQVTEWISAQSSYKDFSLGYFGSSTGAAAAFVAAAHFHHKIAAVVSRGGRTDLAEDAVLQVVSPTLLIVGELDHLIYELNNESLLKLPCTKQLKIIPGATHLFEESGALDEVAQLASRWFQKYLIH